MKRGVRDPWKDRGKLLQEFASRFCGQVFGLQESFEGVEVDGFELAEGLHPDAGIPERVRLQFTPFNAAAFFLTDQAGGRENAEMFGNCGQRHLERVGHVGDSHIVFQQHRQDLTARRVGQC